MGKLAETEGCDMASWSFNCSSQWTFAELMPAIFSSKYRPLACQRSIENSQIVEQVFKYQQLRIKQLRRNGALQPFLLARQVDARVV
jgi:hypothetical protein